MASKKCPKCGEENPAEAVMCWACYTPLTGSAAIPAAAGRPVAGAKPVGAGPAGIPSDEGEGKKQLDPKMFVVGGLLLVGVVVAIGVNVGFGGGGGEDDGTGTGTDPAPSSPSSPGAPPAPAPAAAPVAPPIPSGDTNNAPLTPVALPYNVVVPPNPRYATGTFGILATQTNIAPAQARGLAKFAKDQFARNGKWQNMQIAVFSDPAAAKAFATFQARRRGAPLTSADYRALAENGVWKGAPVFFESRGKKEVVAYPAANPFGWWGR